MTAAISASASPVKVGIRRDAGFTLFEVLVVVTILGLVMGLIATSGQIRSRSIELQSVVDQVARSARMARARAIALHREVRLVLDGQAHSLRLDDTKPTQLPNTIHISMTTIAAEKPNGNLTAIRFNPDGSSTGGQIELAEGTRYAFIGVNWLTSRVSISEIQ